ncbi:MAG: TonB-dependent receptor [Syntrophales bacterium]
MLMIWRCLLILVFFSFSSITFAEEKSSAKSGKKEKEETKLEEIVVTATRTEKALEDAPGSVAVVTKKDMEKRTIQTVDEALNTTVGVYDQRGKGVLDTSPRIMLGGISGYQRTLVIMDGITLNNAYTGNVDWNGFSPEDIERIEVVKGPFSSLYGGYAMGGVVNIITRMPEKREFTARAGYGSAWHRGDAPNDLQTFYTSYGDRIDDKLRLFVSYYHNATNGYAGNFNIQSSKPTAGITGYSITTDRQGNLRYLIGNQGQNDMWGEGGTIKAGYDFSKATKLVLTYMRSYWSYNYDMPQTYLRDAAGNQVFSYGTVKQGSFLSSGGGANIKDIYNASFETEFSSAKIKLNMGLLDIPKDYYVTPDSSSATFSGGPGTLYSQPSGAYMTDLQITLPAFGRHILTFGGSYRNSWSNSTDTTITNWRDSASPGTLAAQNQGKDRTYALFFQDEFLITGNLTAYIGARQDWWETYDGYTNQVGVGGNPRNFDSRNASSFSPKGALVYKPFSETTLRTSIGQAFRPPTVYELYRTTVSSGITYAGNPDLKPETVTSWDIGAEQGLWKGAKAGARYFEHYLKDLIYSRTVSSTYQDKVNAGRAEIKGIELEGEQRFDKWLRLYANFTYTSAYIKENNASPASVDKRMTYVPDIMFNVGADAEAGPVSLSVTGRYVGKRYALDTNADTYNFVYGSYDPFFTADAKIRYKPFKWATVSFSVNNIADERYYVYYLAPGRSWFMELALNF